MRVSLFIQNLAVAICAITVYLVLHFYAEIQVMLDGQLQHICEAIIIGSALLAYLASMAYKIAIEKDWIVVIASGNTNQLASEF